MSWFRLSVSQAVSQSVTFLFVLFCFIDVDIGVAVDREGRGGDYREPGRRGELE